MHGMAGRCRPLIFNEVGGSFIITADNNFLITQSGDRLIVAQNLPEPGNFISTLAGEFLVTQLDEKIITTQDESFVMPFAAFNSDGDGRN